MLQRLPFHRTGEHGREEKARGCSFVLDVRIREHLPGLAERTRLLFVRPSRRRNDRAPPERIVDDDFLDAEVLPEFGPDGEDHPI